MTEQAEIPVAIAESDVAPVVEDAPVAEAAPAAESAVELTVESSEGVTHSQTSSQHNAQEPVNHGMPLLYATELEGDAGKVIDVVEHVSGGDGLFASKTVENDLIVDTPTLYEGRAAKSADERFYIQAVLEDRTEPVDVIVAINRREKTGEDAFLPRVAQELAEQEGILPVHDSLPTQEVMPEPMLAVHLDEGDEIRMTSVEMIPTKMREVDGLIDQPTDVMRKEDLARDPMFDEIHGEIPIVKDRAAEADLVIDRTYVKLDVSEHARDITIEIATEVKDIQVIQDDERVIFSGKNTQRETSEEGAVPSEFIPMTTFTELEGAIDMLMHLPEEPEGRSEREDTHDRKPTVFVISDEFLQMLEEIQQEEGIMKAVHIGAPDNESLRITEGASYKEAMHIAIVTNDEKVTLSKQRIDTDGDQESEEDSVVPIDTYDDLQQAFDYLVHLPEEDDVIEGEDTDRVMLFTSGETERVVPRQKEVVISDEILELIHLFREQVPPREEEDAPHSKEDDQKTIMLTTVGEDKKQVSISTDELRHIQKIFTEHGLFVEPKSTSEKEEERPDETAMKHEEENEAVFQPDILDEPIIPGNTVIIFDRTRRVKKEKPLEVRRTPEQMKKQVVLSSGKREMTVDIETLEKLIELRKKKIQKIVELQMSIDEENAPEEMIQNSMQYRKGYIPQSFNSLTMFLFMTLLDKQLASNTLIPHRFYASQITGLAS